MPVILNSPSEEFLEALGLGMKVLSGITENKEIAKCQMRVHGDTGQSCTALMSCFPPSDCCDGQSPQDQTSTVSLSCCDR